MPKGPQGQKRSVAPSTSWRSPPARSRNLNRWPDSPPGQPVARPGPPAYRPTNATKSGVCAVESPHFLSSGYVLLWSGGRVDHPPTLIFHGDDVTRAWTSLPMLTCFSLNLRPPMEKMHHLLPLFLVCILTAKEKCGKSRFLPHVALDPPRYANVSRNYSPISFGAQSR